MKFFRTRGAALALASALAAALLTGCAAAVVGGAVGTGALLMTADRRSAETQDADQAIEAGAREVVAQALAGRGHVNVASYYRKALITGEVPSVQDRQLMETRVRALPGVQGVVNELAVMPESSAFQRSNDAFITSKVRGRLVGTNGVPSASIKVLTERGTTYLMGRLTATEMALATDSARQTEGVQRVVRVIDLIVDPAVGNGTAASSGATVPAPAQDAAVGVQTHPVTQPAIVNAPQPIQVQTLPPAR
ncbi:MAG TPA: BON domain-containing protein [Ottowia sp.]|nr:BON domain-containing protein [Ottowia sp.]